MGRGSYPKSCKEHWVGVQKLGIEHAGIQLRDYCGQIYVALK